MISPLIEEDGKVVMGRRMKVVLLNSFFDSVFAQKEKVEDGIEMHV